MGILSRYYQSSGIFLAAIFFIRGMMIKRKNMIDNIFSEYFIDPSDRNNWEKIESVLEPHVIKNLIPIGATPTKPTDENDGSVTPIRVSKLASDLAVMFDQADKLSILKNPDELRYYFDETIDPQQNIEAYMRWDAILAAYEVLKNLEDNLALLIESIRPLYRAGNNSVRRTPAQLWFNSDEYMHGSLIDRINYQVVPWETIDQFKSDNPSTLGILDVILEHDFRELWYIYIPTVTITSEVESIHVDSSIVFTTLNPSSFGLPYAVELTFVSDPGSPSATATFETEYWTSKVIRFSVSGGPNSGTITANYKTLRVS